MIQNGYDPDDFIELVDGGKSAKNLGRPQLQFLLKEIIADRVDKVIIFDLARMSRDVSDSNTFVKVCIKHNVKLLCVKDSTKYETANQRGVFNITQSVAQMEREIDAERVQRSMEYMTSIGKWVYGKPPFGWKKDKDQRLIIVEEEAYWLKIMNDMLKMNYTYKQIQDYLNEEQALNQVWSYFVVYNSLNRTINYGEFKGIENFCPPIISKEEYEEAHKNKRKHYKTNVNKFYYLPKVKCSCGYMVITDSSKKGSKRYLYYFCPTCNKRMNQDIITAQIQPYLIPIFEKTESKFKNELQNKLQKLLRKKEECYRKYLADALDLDIYNDLVVNITHDIEVLNKRIDESSQKVSERKVNKHVMKHIKFIEVDMDKKKIIKVEYVQKSHF